MPEISLDRFFHQQVHKTASRFDLTIQLLDNGACEQKTSHRPSKSDGSEIDCSCSLKTVVSKKRKAFPALATQLPAEEDSSAAAAGFLPPSSASTSARLCTPVRATSSVQLGDRT